DDRTLAHDLGHPRKPFTNAEAPDGGVDDAELAADALRGLRLGVPHVDGRGTAVQPDHDGGGGAGGAAPALGSRSGFHLQELRQAETEESRGTDPQEVAPPQRRAVAPAA